MFHLDYMQPSNAMVFGYYALFIAVSYHKMQFSLWGQIKPILYLFYNATTILGQQLHKGRSLYMVHVRSSSLLQPELGVNSLVMLFPFQCHIT